MTREEISQWTESLRPGTVRELFEYLPDLMYFAKDAHLRLMGGNRAFVHHCGLSSEDDLLGKTDHDLFPPQMAEKFAQDDRHILETGKPVNDLVELFPDEMGYPEWYTTDKIPLFDRQGKIAGLCGLVRRHQVDQDSPLKKVTDLLNRKNPGKITIADMASEANLSVRQLERKFRETYKTTPGRYVMRLRILRACDLLRTTRQSVSEIAHALGFYDHSAFSRKFSELIGEPPGVYRKRFRQKTPSRLASGKALRPN
jgi:AraC-like DNA-binding protein